MRERALEVSDTEERILKAALDVVNEETISGTRIHLIAKKADVAQSNVHYYYRTKQDLMDSLQERVLDEFYEVRRNNPGADTLEGQLHVFFEQKKYMVLKKKDYDFAELNFMIQSKINPAMKERFQEAYEEWRKDIRAVIERYCPELPETEKERIPYLAVSLLEGASLQVLVDPQDFNADLYFEAAEEMVLSHIRNAKSQAK